jgi:hypothetical protein
MFPEEMAQLILCPSPDVRSMQAIRHHPGARLLNRTLARI